VSLPDPQLEPTLDVARAKPLLSADEALAAIGHVVSRSSWYAALARGEGPRTTRVGRRVFVVVNGPEGLREWAGMTNGDAPTGNGARGDGVHDEPQGVPRRE
jgi:hypothetical protein